MFSPLFINYNNKIQLFKKSQQTYFNCLKITFICYLNRNLSPEEYFTLHKKHPNMYLIHDDFYDPETGVALQPLNK